MGEGEFDARLHLHLVQFRGDHFDGVFDRADVDLRRRQLLERGVQRGGLAGTGRPRHQHDAVRAGDHLLPGRLLGGGETELAEALGHGVRIENAQHAFFAEGGRHGGQTQLDLAPGRGPGFDPTVLGPALFGYIHPAQNFDAAGDGGHHRRRQLIDRVQHAVDAKPDIALLAARLQMDVAGALGEGVLQQPIHDLDDRPFVGAQFAAAAQFQQLLEIENAGRRFRRSLERAAHRARHAVEFHLVAVDIQRIGDHPLDVAPQRLAQHGLPVAQPRFGGGEHHAGIVRRDRQNLVTGGVFEGNERQQAFDRRDVELERIDAQVRQSDLVRQPFRERFQTENLMRRLELVQFFVGDHHQRMQFAAFQLGTGQRQVGVCLGHPAIGD